MNRSQLHEFGLPKGQQECPYCRGMGHIVRAGFLIVINDKCKHCDGSGLVALQRVGHQVGDSQEG